MIRYALSKIFANTIPQTDSKKFLRLASLGVYRDEILAGVQAVLAERGLSVDAENMSLGRAAFRIRADEGSKPCQFFCDTEWGDFLLATGREAGFSIRGPSGTRFFYYGNSWNPDNSYQWENRRRKQGDIKKIADWVAEECKKIPLNAAELPKPKI